MINGLSSRSTALSSHSPSPLIGYFIRVELVSGAPRFVVAREARKSKAMSLSQKQLRAYVLSSAGNGLVVGLCTGRTPLLELEIE